MTIYGRNSVQEAIIEKIKISKIIIDSSKREKFANIISQANILKIPVLYDNKINLEKLSKTKKHQGIIALLENLPNVFEEEENITKFQEWDKFYSIVVLDGITDTGNLGAIIRSAVLFNFDAIILPNDNSARITPNTIKSSAGAIYKINIFYVNNLNKFILTIKDKGFAVYGLSVDGNFYIDNLEINQKICLVLGAERNGIRKSVKKNCDKLISIPTTKKLDSLNVSNAASIAMWEVFRKLRNA